MRPASVNVPAADRRRGDTRAFSYLIPHTRLTVNRYVTVVTFVRDTRDNS